MPKIGTNGTSGVLKFLFKLGSLTRRIQTAAQTKINANKVPILVKSPATEPGTNAAKKPTNKNKIIFDL